MTPIALENAKGGTADWQLQRPAINRQVEGYALATSVQRGEAIGLCIHTPTGADVVLEVFRLGWYGGLGSRRVLGPVTVPGIVQPMPTMDPATGMVDCDWQVSHRLVTAEDDGRPWCSGVYLARLIEGVQTSSSYIIFVVRDDRARVALRVQLGFSTYQAYNTWGGKSLYHWGSGGERASQVSFNRPYALNPAAPSGLGAGEFLTNLQPPPARYGPSNAGWDVNMLRWLERQGYDLAYTTSLDTHADGAAMRRAGAWLSIGHDEYWSWAMRDHVEAARDAGVHLGFFTANAAYWQVRFEPDRHGEPRFMVCHKKARRDPARAANPGTRRLTDKWRCADVARPEDDLLGVMYQGDPVDADIVVCDASHWALEGTGLANGDRLPGLLGYEVDGVHDAGKAQAMGLALIAASPWTAMNDPHEQGVAHMASHTAASGALVVATGSIQWPWGLDDFNAPQLRSARRHPACERITRNVLARMGAMPAA